MSEEREFDYVVGKLPRKDKNGNDTTSDHIGKGGRHRDDGTYSAVLVIWKWSMKTLLKCSPRTCRLLSAEKL